MVPLYPTYHDYLRHWAETMPDHVAFISDEGTMTYAQALAESERLAAWLLSQGIERGDRIVYALPARPAFFSLLGAASMVGAVVVGVGLTYTPYEIAAIANSVKPKMAFASSALVEKVQSACGVDASVAVAVGDDFVAGYRSYAECIAEVGEEALRGVAARSMQVESADPFMIIHTSGTTGAPKGAIVTHANAIASARAQARGFCAPGGCVPEDVIQHQVPTNHVSGAVEWGVAPVVAGMTSILNDAFDARRILENTERYRATILAGVPAMWKMMFRLIDQNSYDFGSVRWTMVGAAPGSSDMFERIMEIAPICGNPLGMTETSGFCTYTDPSSTSELLAATVGRPIDALECILLNDDGTPVADGEVGRIAYRGDTVVAGYYNNPEATARAFRDDGFFVTDDLACFDAQGNLCLRGRSDDMFLSRGFCVYPAEIEMALLAHPDVEMAAVLPIPHKLMGQVPRAYVVPRAGSQLAGAQLRSALAERLADYKIPRSFKIVESLPLTALGKPRKKELAEQIAREFEEAGK